MKDVLCVGDAIIDAFLGIPKESVHCHVNEKTCELSFTLGQKIPLDTCDFLLGGNASNVSVGVTRLGLGASLIAEVGDDEFAQKILRGLSEEHVDTTFVLQTETPSSCAFGLNYDGERTLFVKHMTRKHDFSFPQTPYQYVYLTSLGNVWEHAYSSALWFAHENRIPLVCNPGTLQLQSGLDTIRLVLEKTAVLFLNREESQGLLQNKTDDIKVLLAALQKLGPQTVVITDGKEGSYTIDKNGQRYHVPILKHPIVERTGAGDAYASGFLAALTHGKAIREAMQWGTLNAAAVIGKIGAQPGLLSYNQMEKEVKNQQHLLVATVI